jgi:hypothetical protein
MTKRGIAAPELMFLSLAAAGAVGMIGVALQLILKVTG